MTNALPAWLPDITKSLFTEIASKLEQRVGIASVDGGRVAIVAISSEMLLAIAQPDQPSILVVTDPKPIDDQLAWIAQVHGADAEGNGAFWVADLRAISSQEAFDAFFGRLMDHVTGVLEFEDEVAKGDVDRMLNDMVEQQVAQRQHAAEAQRLAAKTVDPVKVGPFEILLDTRESISFIGAYNKRPTVHRLGIRTIDGNAYDELTVRLELASLGVKLAESWVREVERLGPKGVIWDPRDFSDLRLDSNLFSQITERQHAEFTLTIERGGELIASTRQGIELLAADAWAGAEGAPLRDFVTDLAALVQPQKPSLRPILDAAASRLKAKTGNDYSGLSGYQSFDATGKYDYVDAMVQSIWESAQQVGIVYSNPPSSWDLGALNGQRVRRPGQVIGERVGTCLDTTVLMASLLAAVDLQPLVILIPGHAFVGYWREESWRNHPIAWPLIDGQNWVDAKRVVPIETTLLTNAEANYGQAFAAGKDRFNEGSLADDPRLAAGAAAVDVAVAHRLGTVPLPVRVPQADGSIALLEYKPQELKLDLLDQALAAQRSTSTGLQVNDAPRRVKRWMDSLLDLSLRNPLLNYRFPQVSSVSLLVPDGFLGRLEDMLQSGVKVGLGFNPYVDRQTGQSARLLTPRRTLPEGATDLIKEATDELVGRQGVLTALHPDVFVNRMRRMLNNAKSVIDETGSNQLYLALGMVSWVPDGRDQELSAPLILLPVSIVGQNRNREFRLEIDATGQVTPNFSLAERLRIDAKLDLPKLVAPDLDGAGIDVEALITYVRDEFIKSGLTDYRVDESCTLGFFDFSTYRLWKDLKDNWGRFGDNSPLVKHLINTATQPFADPVQVDPDENIDDFAASLPVLADGSQARAVHDAMQGKTFVLQGPPGTGKSQTITNLLARALHGGKRVLFVAEKPDALAVVRDRLAKVGLGTFGLNLHDKGMKPADVRQQVSDALSVNALPDKTGFDAATRDIARTVTPLQKYPERLHNAGPLGESAYSARDKLLAISVTSSLPVPASFIAATNLETVDRVRAVLRDIREAASNAGTARDNPWSLARIGASGFGAEQRDTYLQLVTATRSVGQ